MKKLLTLLLIFTLFLTSCTTQPLKDTSSSENHTLYEYAQSQEALDFVKRVAAETAGINFSSINFNDREEVFESLYLTCAIYDEIKDISVDKSQDSKHIGAYIKDVCPLIEKYFGKGAVPKRIIGLDETVWCTRTNKWDIQSVEFGSFSENVAEYIINFKYDYSNFDYVCKMRFNVLCENGETWLQLISNTCEPIHIPEYSLEEKAKALSKVLFDTMTMSGLYNLEKDTLSPSDFNNDKLNWFLELLIASSCEATISNNSFDEACPYYRVLDADIFNEWFVFPKDETSRIIYEVFGNSDFALENYAFYDDERNAYVKKVEFGAYADVREEITVSTLQDGTILSEVTCKFYTDETYTDYTERTFSLKLKPITENGETFLRLI